MLTGPAISETGRGWSASRKSTTYGFVTALKMQADDPYPAVTSGSGSGLSHNPLPDHDRSRSVGPRVALVDLEPLHVGACR